MMYVIYKHTSPSGKSYIGQTNNLRRRETLHKNTSGCRAFHSAIKKYGWDNFIHEILCEGLTLEQANECEEEMIALHQTLAPLGYNLTSGGLNKIPSTEVKEHLRKIRTGTKHKPESIEKMKGRKISEDTKLKQSIARAARPKRVLTDEEKEKVSAVHKGKKLSPETIAKRTASRKLNKQNNK